VTWKGWEGLGSGWSNMGVPLELRIGGPSFSRMGFGRLCSGKVWVV